MVDLMIIIMEHGCIWATVKDEGISGRGREKGKDIEGQREWKYAKEDGSIYIMKTV
jgi:hypothetical protein